MLSEAACSKPLTTTGRLLDEPNKASLLGKASSNKASQGLSDALKEVSISTLVIKSKIGQFCLPRDVYIAKQGQSGTEPAPVGFSSKLSPGQGDKTKCAELLQGPTFLFACNSHREMTIGCKVISNKRDRWSNSHAVLLGGLYYGKVVTHLDIAKLSALDSSIYASLPVALENKSLSLVMGGLSHHQDELLRCLEWRRGNLLQGAIPPQPNQSC